MVVVEPAGEVARGRPDLDQVGPVPRAAERDGRLAEERVDVHRLVGLARAALLLLLDEPDHRRVALRERLLVARARSSRGAGAEHGDGQQREEHGPFHADRSGPASWAFSSAERTISLPTITSDSSSAVAIPRAP